MAPPSCFGFGRSSESAKSANLQQTFTCSQQQSNKTDKNRITYPFNDFTALVVATR